MNFLHKKDGFSLPEALIGVFILIAGVVPVVGLVVKTVHNVNDTRNRVIAANLAQEGVEIVRSIRDTNFLNDRPFNQNLSTTGTWCGNYNHNPDNALSSCPVSGARLCLPSSGLFYTHNCGAGTTQTPFFRSIYIQMIPNPAGGPEDIILVQSRVRWSNDAGDSITAATHLYPWK